MCAISAIPRKRCTTSFPGLLCIFAIFRYICIKKCDIAKRKKSVGARLLHFVVDKAKESISKILFENLKLGVNLYHMASGHMGQIR